MSADEGTIAPSTVPKTDQQKQILQEILITEEHYIEDLKILIEVFKNPISEKKLLTPQEIARLFSNVEALLAVNERLFEGLQTSEGNYGRVFVEKAETLKLYGIYCSTQSLANVRLKEFTQKYPEFDQFIEKCFDHPRCRQLGLDSFMMAPMQRITKYPLLLGELLRKTPKEDPEHANITKALAIMKDIVETVNDRTRSVQNVHKLSDIQKKIIGGDQLGLVQKDRELIYQGSLVTDYYGKNKKGVKPWGILFSDFLLMCYFTNRPKNEADIKEPIYTIQKRINFEGGRKLVVVAEGPNISEENSFQLIYEKKKSDGRVVEHKPKFYVLTRDDKQTWATKFTAVAKRMYIDYKRQEVKEAPKSLQSARGSSQEADTDEVRTSSSGGLKSARASIRGFKDFRKKMKLLMDRDSDSKLERIDSAGDRDDFEDAVKDKSRRDSISGPSSKKSKKETAQEMVEAIFELQQVGVGVATENELLTHSLVQLYSRVKELEGTATEQAEKLGDEFKPRQFDAIVQQTLKKYVPALKGDTADAPAEVNPIERINEIAGKYEEYLPSKETKGRPRLVTTGPPTPQVQHKTRPMSVNLSNSAPHTLQKLFDEPPKEKESRSRRGSKSGKLKRTSTDITGSNDKHDKATEDPATKELMTFISPRSLSFAKASPQSFASSLFDSPGRKVSGHRTVTAGMMDQEALEQLRSADKPEPPPKPARRQRSTSSSSDRSKDKDKDKSKRKRAPTPPPKVLKETIEGSEIKTESEKSDEPSQVEEGQTEEKKAESGPAPTEHFRDQLRLRSRSRSLNQIVITGSPRRLSQVSEDTEDSVRKRTSSQNASPASVPNMSSTLKEEIEPEVVKLAVSDGSGRLTNESSTKEVPQDTAP